MPRTDLPDGARSSASQCLYVSMYPFSFVYYAPFCFFSRYTPTTPSFLPPDLSIMLLSLRSLALGGLALASSAYASSSLFAGTVVSCPVTNSTPLSCHSTGTQSNTCCFNEPGGLLLQTQFWDTNPPSGPANSWTAHGLWPDNCDGTWVPLYPEAMNGLGTELPIWLTRQ